MTSEEPPEDSVTDAPTEGPQTEGPQTGGPRTGKPFEDATLSGTLDLRQPMTEEWPLLRGPGSRTEEFFRACRIFAEFIRGFRALHFIGPCVTVFGSARFEQDHPYSLLAERTAQRAAEAGYAVMTGGGPGIMEAANRGAKLGDGVSIGCGIQLPFEEAQNEHIDIWVKFNYFFVRKVMLVKYSQAFIVMPGGFGTMDEIFETATLIQTRKIKEFPLILMGSEYWKPLLDFQRNVMVKDLTISPDDPDRFFVTDSPEEALEAIRRGSRWYGKEFRKQARQLELFRKKQKR